MRISIVLCNPNQQSYAQNINKQYYDGLSFGSASESNAVKLNQPSVFGYIKKILKKNSYNSDKQKTKTISQIPFFKIISTKQNKNSTISSSNNYSNMTPKALDKNPLRYFMLEDNKLYILKNFHKNNNMDLIIKAHFSPISNYNKNLLPIHYCNGSELEEINKVFEEKPDLLAKLYLSKDPEGDLPAHKNPTSLKSIHKALSSQPEILKQIHLTQGFLDMLPAHVKECNIDDIHEIFKDDPETLIKIHTSKMYGGDLPCHNPDKIPQMLKALEKFPEAISQILLTPNDLGFLPLHKCADSNKKFKESLELLKDKPELLAKIFTTPINNGRILAHIIPFAGESMKLVYNALQNQPEIIAQILLTKDNDGFYPSQIKHKISDKKILYSDKNAIKEIKKVLKNYPKLLNKVLTTIK